jgi:hypothetical protein
MSSKKVLALYNGNEMLLDIEINYDNLYNSFLDIFRQKFNERDPSINKFKLTTINTSIPYLLIDPNNIKSIIEEKIENNAPLKILLTKEEEFDELKKDSMEENFFCGYMKEVSAFEEDFNDEEFIIGDKDTDIDIKVSENQNEKEIKENEKKEEELNRILTKSLSKEINDENIDEKKKENENEAKNDIAIEDMDNLNLNENLRLSSNFNFNSFNNNEYDNNDDNSDDENKKKEKENDNNNNNNKITLPVIPLNLPKNVFKEDICTLCGNHIFSYKYICGICENCDLCERCEEIHIHPCFKYKTTFLSNLIDTYKYIDRNYDYKIPMDSKKMTKLIRKEYNLKIVPMTDRKFIVPPNKVIDLPVKILNLSDHEVNSSQFIIIIKNNLLINISYQVDKIFTIKPNEEYELRLLCRTPAIHSMERINIEIYSAELNIRMSSRLSFDLEIEINDDKEDETLNNQLNNDKYAIFHTKAHKRIILSMLYYKDDWKYKLRKVCQVLRDNKFDTKKSIEILTTKKKKK